MYVCSLVSIYLYHFDDNILALEVLIDQYGIPEEVAAVTLIALSSASPELLLSCVSASKHKSASLSLPATCGSGLIAFGIIPAICVLLHAPNHTTSTSTCNNSITTSTTSSSLDVGIPLATRPIIREVSLYIHYLYKCVLNFSFLYIHTGMFLFLRAG